MRCDNIFQAYNLTFDYIEENLLDPNLVRSLESQSFFTVFHIRRSFSYLTNLTLADYIRNRRLTVVAISIKDTGNYDPDIYRRAGYSTLRTFENAFYAFHGCYPKELLQEDKAPQIFQRFHLKVEFTGGDVLDYDLVKEDSFFISGKKHVISYESSETMVPAIFTAFQQKNRADTVYSLVRNDGVGETFTFFIGKRTDYCDKEECVNVPALEWMKFTLKGVYPKINEIVRKQILNEFIPSMSKFRLADNILIEKYYPGDPSDESYTSEIWLPVERI